jgi:hypothetical protein
MFNPHNNRTADGTIITEGLMVFTNELMPGKVVGDPDCREVTCCATRTSEVHDVPAQYQPEYMNGGWYTNHRKGDEAVAQGCYCRHNHWFRIETSHGIKSMDGERLATVFEGRKAADVIEEGGPELQGYERS